MSFKVLHILDSYLPETMNWLDALMECTQEHCEHHLASSYWINGVAVKYPKASVGIVSNYPVSRWNKLVHTSLDWIDTKKLKEYVKSKQIEILHFHFANTAIRSMGLIRELKIPILVSFYGYDYEYLVKQKPKTLDSYQQLAKLGVSFTVEGSYSKGLLIHYGIPANQIFKLHLLYPRTGFTSRLKYKTPIRIIQAASFTEKKNQLTLLESLRDDQAGKFQFLFIGEIVDKHYFNEIKLVLKSKKHHCIQIKDKHSTSTYLEQLSRQHFSVNLSKRSKLHDTEGGCPVFIKDSLALSKPVITAMHCDIPETVIHGFNGYLVDAEDSTCISDCLDQLIGLDQLTYNKLCTNALHSVQANAVNNLTGKELISIYAKCYEDCSI